MFKLKDKPSGDPAVPERGKRPRITETIRTDPVKQASMSAFGPRVR
jgi:hypothetical protein